MNQLTLKSVRFEQVESKVKTATLRSGAIHVNLGESVVVDTETQKQLPVKVTKVVVCKMNELTEEMLQKNNYKNYDDAKKTMTSLYPYISDNSVVTHVEFELLG